MGGFTLGLVVVWVLLVAGVPTVVQARRTGRVAALRVRDRPGAPQWWARLLSLVGFAGVLAGPVAELAGLEPGGGLDRIPVRVAGVALAVLGIAGTLAAQQAMGDSWRSDADPDVRTPLVTSGPFRLVRNPVLAATAATAVGLALTVPNLVMAMGLVAVLAAHQVQVRLVEEPYLLRMHGADYARYAARTGRFLPWIGRRRPGD